MALADTARLVASLELQDKFSKTLGSADRSLGGFERKLGPAQRATKGLGVAGTAAGVALGSLAASGIRAGFRLLTGTLQGGVASLNELETQTVATNTVLKSTKGIAGITADAVRNLAEKYEDLNATIDDKVIQSGENLLLTFTNIRKDAFEPALQAALDMNEAMGGGEQGLQRTIIQVGKALQDPIRGATALRRVGVNLTQQQQDQIKTLVEQNKLYKAQQIVLDELSTEFGGRFSAAGKTAEGQTAALADKVEDLEQAFAGPLIPAIARVKDHLIDLLGSRSLTTGAGRLGSAIASIFSEENLDKGVALVEKGIDAITGADFKGATGTLSSVVGSVAGLPWGAIADAAKLLGTGSKALLTAFTSLPGWVQTAVLTGWGLNKLTGGALGGIVGELGKGLVKGVLGMNAGVVNINAATVNGGVPGVGGGGGGSNLPGILGVSVLGAAIAEALRETGAIGAVNQPLSQLGLTPQEIAAVKALANPPKPGERRVAIDPKAIETGTAKLQRLGVKLVANADGTYTLIQTAAGKQAASQKITDGILSHSASEHNKVIRQEWRAASQKIDRGIIHLASSERADSQREQQRLDRVRDAAQRGLAANLRRLDTIDSASRRTADHTAQAIERIRAVEGASRATASNTAAVARKNFSPNVDLTVGVTNQISISTITGAIQRDTYSTATGRIGGPIV